MRHRRSAAPALLAAALLLVSGAARVHAQGGAARFTASVDAGAAEVTFDEYLSTSAFTLSPSGRLDLARGSVSARGAVSQFPSGNRSWQGVLAGSWLVPVARGITGELGASGSSTYYDGVDPASLAGDEAGSLLGEARLHFTGARRGAWVGYTGGVAADGIERRTLAQGELAVWGQLGRATLTAALRPTRADEFLLADAELSARWWWRSRLELSGRVGARAGDAPGGARSWQELGAAWWMGTRVALVAGAGRYPADLLNGVPGARFVTASLRVASRPPARLEAAARPNNAGRAAPLALLRALPAGDLQLRLLADGQTMLRLRAPEAATLELMGDFTDWEPVPLTRGADGMWEGRFPLAPGTYRFNVRRDGGAWEVPIGVTALPDDLGGNAGIFVVG